MKQQWAKLTDDDMREIEANLDLAAGKLQERYGLAREQAEQEWNRFCSRCAAEGRVTED
jgi:uncharacterized protein YjbJ (UPF0337 family)